jgi:hypothetical protein
MQSATMSSPRSALLVRAALPGGMLLAACMFAAMLPAHADASRPVERVRIYQLALAQRIAEPARAVYHAIEGDGRRLLAGRSYLRAGDSLTARWSWSSAEIERFNSSKASRELAREIDAIVLEFEKRNPGYSLYANREVRSIEIQLQRWNANPTVAKVADQLQRAAERHLSGSGYPDVPDVQALDRFGKFLAAWQPQSPSPLAAPGLSAHGRARAIDFAVRSGDRIVAATDTSLVSTVWDGQGWTARLQAAVQASSSKFKGPLASPREPWHYEYSP